LGALAFAQPLFELLGGSPEFFAARGGGRGDVLGTMALALLGLPLPWLAGAFVARRWAAPRACARMLAALVGSLCALVVLRGLALAALPALAAVALAAGALATAGWAYLKSATARLFATFLAPALVVVPALFALDPGIARHLEAPPRPIALHRSGGRVPVAIVLFDELSLASLLDETDAIDARRFPSFGRFAAESTWFRNAAAPAWSTGGALPAVLSGRVVPAGDRLQLERNLFTLLGDYPTYSIEAWSAICPGDHNRLVAQRPPAPLERARRLVVDLPVVWFELVTPPAWRPHLPPLTAGWDRFAAAPRLSLGRRRGGDGGMLARRTALRSFLDSIAPAPRALWFGHLMFPHAPWEVLPSGRLYACKPECFPPALNEDEPWRAAQLYQRYLLQLGYTDALLGEVVARLRRAGLYDRALVVVLADHGTAFRPRLPHRSTAVATLDQVLAVPLLVKRPGQRVGAVVDERVSTADLVATVADVVGVRPPWPLPGESLFSGRPRDPRFLDESDALQPVPRDLAARRREAVRELARLTAGSGGDPWRIGPYPALLGQRALADGEAAGLGAALDFPERYRAVDPATGKLPLLVTGTLDGSVRGDGCCALAVAVNGTVEATTHSFWTAEGEQRLAAMVPERALRAGENEIALFAVAPDGRTLRAIRRKG
jgi:hypothetical protein